MVVTFVGFVGGWTRQVLVPDAVFLGAALTAMVVTWFTFLPSFVFILAGGPFIESTHGRLQFTAPLTALTAAVVGVIASLAVCFIGHIARRSDGAIDGVSRGLVALAALALFRFKLGVVPVVAGCAAAGLLLRLTGLA